MPGKGQTWNVRKGVKGIQISNSLLALEPIITYFRTLPHHAMPCDIDPNIYCKTLQLFAQGKVTHWYSKAFEVFRMTQHQNQNTEVPASSQQQHNISICLGIKVFGRLDNNIPSVSFYQLFLRQILLTKYYTVFEKCKSSALIQSLHNKYRKTKSRINVLLLSNCEKIGNQKDNYESHQQFKCINITRAPFMLVLLALNMTADKKKRIIFNFRNNVGILKG